MGGTMKPFIATYTDRIWESDKNYFVPDEKTSRDALILAIFELDYQGEAIAVFVDADNTLKEATISHFTTCHIEWPSRLAQGVRL